MNIQRFFLFSVASVLLFVLAQATELQGLESSSTVASSMDMPPSLTVLAVTPQIVAEIPLIGQCEATAEFDVQANKPRVRMHVEATELHFTEDPEGTHVSPIPLDRGEGVVVDTPGATPEGDTRLDFEEESGVLDGFQAWSTEEVVFASDAPYRFEHRVLVSVTWNQEVHNKPAGSYEGRIKLTCMIEP